MAVGGADTDGIGIHLPGYRAYYTLIRTDQNVQIKRRIAFSALIICKYVE